MSFLAAAFLAVDAGVRQEGHAQRLAADLSLPYRRPHRLGPRNESSRSPLLASATRLLGSLSSALTSISDQSSSDQSRSDQSSSDQQANATIDEATQEVWTDYDAANSVDNVDNEVTNTTASDQAANVTANATDDANATAHNETLDSDGIAQRTNRITWAMPEATSLANETNITASAGEKFDAAALVSTDGDAGVPVGDTLVR